MAGKATSNMNGRKAANNTCGPQGHSSKPQEGKKGRYFMKRTKRIIAILMTLTMILSMTIAMSATVFAADDHTITINQNNTDGTAGAESYNLYKIFDVTKTSDASQHVTTEGGPGEDSGFSYTISTSNPWFSVLGSVSGGAWTPATGQNWVTLTKSAGSSTLYNVTWDPNKNSETDAKEFADFLRTNKGSIAADKTATSDGDKATVQVSDGYWLIDSTLGTNLILATTNINIDTKNTYPTTEKTVAATNYNVGDMVDYTITVNLPATVDYTKPVIVHDTMDGVLALDASSVHAKVATDNDFDSHVTLVQSSSFDADHDNASHAAASGKVLYDFVLDINSLAPAAGETATAKTVTITYKAELTSAALADTEYVNEEFVEYSKYKTPESKAKIKTFDFDLKKTFEGQVKADLVATFELADSDGNTIQFINDNNRYVKKDSDDTGASATLTVHGDAVGINVRGLKAGTYTLTEKTTSDGYNLLTTPITVTIDAEGNVTIGQGELFQAADNTITVNNQTGTVLPSTGGIGTIIFYVLGSILVIGCGIVLISKRRVNNK